MYYRIAYVYDYLGNQAVFYYNTSGVLENITIKKYVVDETIENDLHKYETISYLYENNNLTAIDHTTNINDNYYQKYEKEYEWREIIPTPTEYESQIKYFDSSFSSYKYLYRLDDEYQDNEDLYSDQKLEFSASTIIQQTNYEYDKYKKYDKVCFTIYQRDTSWFSGDDYYGTYCVYIDETPYQHLLM